MKLFDFLCDLFEVENIEDITQEMITEMENSIVENSSVKKGKVRHTKYNNMVEIRTMGDEKTCPVCKKLDGKKFPRKKALEILRTKTHPNCRCKIVPVK